MRRPAPPSPKTTEAHASVEAASAATDERLTQATREVAPFQDWGCLHISLVWAYEGLVRPEGRHLTLEDSYIRCWLIRKGRVMVTAHGEKREAGVGQWVILNGGRHTQDFTDDARILSVKFQLTWPNGESLFPRIPPLVIDSPEHPELERTGVPLMRLVKRHFPSAHDYLPQLACSLEVYFRVQHLLPPWLLAFRQIMARNRVVPSRLMVADSRSLEAIRMLDHHPLGTPFSEGSLARKIGLSRAQLNRILTRDFSVSTRTYLERRKQESACEALLHTDISVKELGYTLGFRHVSHFCAWFKRLTRTTPSEFRRGSAAGVPVEAKPAKVAAAGVSPRRRPRAGANRP
ncbi:MAG: helix-turn-helix transcriptional regulator [Opitutaceae bacterium]|nr:helix-turn-helix transcriptional regulator [Opitutaceae bacterium]